MWGCAASGVRPCCDWLFSSDCVTSLVALTRGVPQGSAVGPLLFPSSKSAEICLHLENLRRPWLVWARSALTLETTLCGRLDSGALLSADLCAFRFSSTSTFFYTHFKLHLHPLISHELALSDWPASPQTFPSFSYLLEKMRYEAVVVQFINTGGGEFGQVAFLFSY